MRRLRRLFLWGALGLVLFAGVALLILFNTPLSERVAERYLQKALQESGGRLTIEARRGSLAGGLDLDGVALALPSGTTFTAEHLRLRLSRTALLSGTLLLKELSLDRPDLQVVTIEDAGAPHASEGPPRWLRVSAPKVTVNGGSLSLRAKGRGPGDDAPVWSGIHMEGDLSWFMSRLSVRLASLRVSPPAPMPGPLSARGSVRLAEDGSGDLDLDLTSPRSSASVRGSWRVGKEAHYRGALALGSVSLREVAIGWNNAPDLFLQGKVKVEGSGNDLRYIADLQATGMGPVSSEGRLAEVAGGLDLSGDCRTTGALLTPFWPTPPGREAKVSGTGTWAVTLRHGQPFRWHAKASLGPSAVWGLALNSARVEASGTPSAVDIAGAWSSPLAGGGDGSARFDLAEKSWRTEAASPAVKIFDLLKALGLKIPLPSAVVPPEEPWSVPRFRAEGNGHLFSLQAVGTDPAGGHWTVDLDPMGSRFVGCTLAFEKADPSAFGLLPAHHGRLTGNARYVAGEAGGAMDVGLEASEWSGFRIAPTTVRLRFAADRTILAPLAITTDAGSVTLAGSFFGDGRAEGSLETAVPDLAKLRPLFGPDLPVGNLTASMGFSGPLRAPALRGEATLAGAQFGSVTAGKVRVQGHWNPGGGGSDLSLAWSDAAFKGTPVGKGTLTLTGDAASASLGLAMEAGQDRSVMLTARGRVEPAGVDLEVKGGKVEAQGRSFLQEGSARLVVNREAVSWTGLTLTKKGSRLTTSGHIGLEGAIESAPLAATVRAERLPLALLPFPKTAGTIGGALDADLSWSGTVGRPLLRGSAGLAEGSYRYADSDRAITPVTASLRAEGDRLILSSLRATTPEGGEAVGSGSVRFAGLWPAEFLIEIRGTDFPFVAGPNIDGVADFAATFSGSLEAPSLEGKATVKKGRIQLPEMERRKALPDTVRFINAPPGSPYATVAPREPSMVGPLRGKFRLESFGGLWISSRNLLAELTGSVTAYFTPAGPALDGSLEILQGRFFFEGKKFELHDSRVSFDGTTDLMPYLSIKALYRIQDTDVEVMLTGRASKPDLHLSSIPPMDQADILSVLVTGRSSKDLRTGDSKAVSSSAAGAVALYGATPLMDSARDALGLDSMSVGVGASPQVALSKSLGDSAVLEYQQTFGALPEWWVNLRYRFNGSTSLQTSSSSRGTSGADLFWEHRY